MLERNYGHDIPILSETPKKTINFKWKDDKIETTINYCSGVEEYFRSKKIPPTAPSHDISHFICAFMENMKWDYRKMPNHIAEYNAVALEHILSSYCHYTIICEREPQIDICVKNIFKYLKWFAKDYYKIQSTHPSKKRYKRLLKEFLDNLEIDTVERHFLDYKNVYIHERSAKGKKYQIDVTMLYDNDYKNENLVNYLYDMKKNLYKKAKSWF